MDDKELIDAHRERCKADFSRREEVARQSAADMCMYEGIQWLSHGGSGYGLAPTGALTILPTRPTGNWGEYRATLNETTRIVQNSIAATAPDAILADVYPAGDPSPDSLMQARVIERVVNAFIESSGMLRRRRVANERRAIMGSYLVGFDLRLRERESGDRVIGDSMLQAYHAAPWQLILDPSVDESSLLDHEWVSLETPMTVKEVNRRYGVDIDPKKCQKLGQLALAQSVLGAATGGRLFSQYRHDSQEPAVLVWRHWEKGPDSAGRFEYHRVLIEDPTAKGYRVVKDKNADNPFGAHGLPLERLLGHPRSDNPERMSDTRLLRDAQQQLNMSWTYIMRQLMRSAGWQWFFDERSLPDGMDKQQVRQALSNTVGGVQFWDSGRGRDRNPMPQLVTYPSPQGGMIDMVSGLRDIMRDRGHRAASHFGELKSHVPLGAFQRSIQEAGNVHGERIKSDLESDNRLLEVAAGTVIGLAKREDQGVLKPLRDRGMTDDELAVLVSIDETRPPVSIRVRETTVRRVPHEVRQQRIDTLLAQGTISGPQARLMYARDLDDPISSMDGSMVRAADRAVMKVVAGQEFTPRRLGEYAVFFLDAFMQAMTSERALTDPVLAERLQATYDAIVQSQGEEALMRDPQFVAENMRVKSEEANAAALGPEPLDDVPMTLADAMPLMMEGLGAGGGEAPVGADLGLPTDVVAGPDAPLALATRSA